MMRFAVREPTEGFSDQPASLEELRRSVSQSLVSRASAGDFSQRQLQMGSPWRRRAFSQGTIKVPLLSPVKVTKPPSRLPG